MGDPMVPAPSRETFVATPPAAERRGHDTRRGRSTSRFFRATRAEAADEEPLSIHLAAIADFDHEHHEPVMFEAHENPDVADAIAPDARELADQCLAELAWIAGGGDALTQEAQDSGSISASEGAQVL